MNNAKNRVHRSQAEVTINVWQYVAQQKKHGGLGAV